MYLRTTSLGAYSPGKTAMAPLHTACKKGDLGGVQAALHAGADVNGKDSVRCWLFRRLSQRCCHGCARGGLLWA